MESPQYEYFSCTSLPTPERLSWTEPCGVWVIQIPYGGSPAATHDGMPMKYSTFRSKRCEPSRCSRIARFVSGVIQFSRPISSSGPHGLSDTFSPSCSCNAFHVKVSSTLAIARSSLSGFDRALLLDQRAVQLGAAVTEEVQLVLTGDDVVLVPRFLEFDVRDQQCLL